MKTTAITVTEAARNFADCLGRVRYQKTSFVLLKNGKPIARLVPDDERICSGKTLRSALKNAKLSPEEARAWRKDMAASRKRLLPPGDKWR